jgi:periplasmic divalent cation tolerance protein
MNMTELVAVFTTVGSESDAVRIAQACVERGLAACVQMSKIDSVYVWDGQLQQDAEIRLLLKTTAARYPELEAALRALHPYELPAIYALDVAKAEPAYAHWVAQSTSAQTC